ncbi:MAG TPA: GNAT family N-acetyltransferase [Puia sp.]|nr:GNAT family N-acetyltransferase [Puia sp.]
MLIRPAVVGEIPAIVTIVNAAYRAEGGEKGWTSEAHLIGGPRTREADVGELMRGRGLILTAWEGAEMVGCVYLLVEGDKLNLGMLSVRPALQGAGTGKFLMAAATEYAKQRQCKAIRITVISVRDELIAWYERHGFRRTGEIEPFHAGDRFGTQKQPLELAVLEREL